MTDVSLVKTIILRAPRERVWAFLTEPQYLARWFYDAPAPLAQGRDYALLRENPVTDDPRMLWGEVLEAIAPERLVYTFLYHGQAPGMESRVVWELAELPGGTKLTLTHTIANASDSDLWEEAKDTDKGWDEHLFRLRSAFQ